MKTFVRAFALSLVVTGAFASVHTAQNTAASTAALKVSACPPPMCPPNDPNACGMGDYGN